MTQLIRKEKTYIPYRIAAIVIALLLHLAWWLLVEPREEPGQAPRPEVTALVYRPVLVQAEGRSAGDALQAVWSPILFSLPTHVGFSQSQLERSGMMLPPAEQPLDHSRLRDAYAISTRLDPAIPLITPAEQANLTRHRLGLDIPHRAPTLSTATASPPAPLHRYHLRWCGAITGEDFLQTELAPNLVQNDGAPREATLYIAISEEGIVSRVMLENRSGNTEWDARLVRAIRSWKGRPANQPRSGRVRISFMHRANTPEAS